MMAKKESPDEQSAPTEETPVPAPTPRLTVDEEVEMLLATPQATVSASEPATPPPPRYEVLAPKVSHWAKGEIVDLSNLRPSVIRRLLEKEAIKRLDD